MQILGGLRADVLRAAAAAAVRRRGLSQLHASFFCQQLERVNKFHAFNFLDKRKHVSTFIAAEAVPNLLISRRHERGGFFVVEGTASLPIGANLLELNVFGNYVHNIKPGFDVIDISRHRESSSIVLDAANKATLPWLDK